MREADREHESARVTAEATRSEAEEATRLYTTALSAFASARVAWVVAQAKCELTARRVRVARLLEDITEAVRPTIHAAVQAAVQAALNAAGPRAEAPPKESAPTGRTDAVANAGSHLPAQTPGHSVDQPRADSDAWSRFPRPAHTPGTPPVTQSGESVNGAGAGPPTNKRRRYSSPEARAVTLHPGSQWQPQHALATPNFALQQLTLGESMPREPVETAAATAASASPTDESAVPLATTVPFSLNAPMLTAPLSVAAEVTEGHPNA